MIKSGDGKMTMADREDMNHKTNLHYEMEDLIPIVGKLAEKYTSYESTSITYEKAEQLMEAVLYCIHENALGQPGQESAMAVLPDNTGASLQQAYEAGAARAREKVKQALALYNEILPGLACYGNRFLQDIFMKELPVFFGRYDVDFAPQNEILTLDYPVLKDISGYRGIDKIYEFIRCVELEQKFLCGLPEGYVADVLGGYGSAGGDMTDNLCEVVLTDMMERIWQGENIEEKMKNIIVHLVKKYDEDCAELTEYLMEAVREILVWQRLLRKNIH